MNPRLPPRWTLALAAALLTAPAAAQQPEYGYDPNTGYGGQGQQGQAPAAPSTIPGQRSSGTRVPQVPPAAAGQRKPPQAAPQGGISWGSGAAGGGAYGGGTAAAGTSGSGYPASTPYGSSSAAPYGSSPSPYGNATGQDAYSPYGAASVGTGAAFDPPGSAGQPAAPSVSTQAPAAPAQAQPAPQLPPEAPAASTLDPGRPMAEPRARAGSTAPVLRQRDSSPAPPPSASSELESANARLGESFRLLGADDTAQLNPGARNLSAAPRRAAVARVQGGSATPVQTQQTIAAPALFCAKNGNVPVLSRVRPANEQGLMPAAAFVVQGNCYGSAPGIVRVMLPTPRGRIRAVDAAVLNWENGKLFAQLPADLQNVIPGEATVEVWAADGRRSAVQTIAFEPQWALRPLPALPSRVRDCQGEFAMSRCAANDDSEADPRFSMPKDCRSSGIGTCFGGNTQDPSAEAGESLIFGQHYSEDLVRYRKDKPSPRGRDVYELNLPPYLRPSHCGVNVTAFETEPGQQDASASVRFEGNTVLVDWAFLRYGEPGWLQYQVRCQVWAPVGVVLP